MGETPDLERAADLYGTSEVGELRELVRRLVAEWADAERRAALSIYDRWAPPEWVPEWARPAHADDTERSD